MSECQLIGISIFKKSIRFVVLAKLHLQILINLIGFLLNNLFDDLQLKTIDLLVLN